MRIQTDLPSARPSPIDDGDQAVFPDVSGTASSEGQLLASIDIQGDVFLGVGARGGALNWAGAAVDVGEASESVIKLLSGETMTPDDQITLYGLVEGGFSDLGGVAKVVEALLGAQGYSFAGHANVQIDLVGRSDGKGLRVGRIRATALPVIPEQTGDRFPAGNFRDWSTVIGVHTWTFPESGGVQHSSDVAFGAGSFGVLNGNQKGDPFFLPGARGLTYVLVSKNFEELTDANYALTQIANHVPERVPGSPRGSSQVISRGADLLVGADVARAAISAMSDTPRTNPDGSFKTTNVRGWLRFVQAVTPEQFATPQNVPMVGLFVEANARMQLVEDGIPEIRIRTSNSDQPLLTITRNDVAAAYRKIRQALSDLLPTGSAVTSSPTGSDNPFHSGPRRTPPAPLIDPEPFSVDDLFRLDP